GSTAARLVSLAGVRGTALAAGLSVKALWVLDASFMLDARHVHAASSFSSLFALHYDQRFSVDDVTTACVADLLEQAPQELTAHLCWSAAELASSLQALRPTQRILRQLAAEDLPRVQQSTAVFLENTPLDSCPGCPANLSLLIPPSCSNCHTLPFSHSLSSPLPPSGYPSGLLPRPAQPTSPSSSPPPAPTATRSPSPTPSPPAPPAASPTPPLRRPDRDFTVAATVPSAAQAVAGMFHESRAPLVLQATRKRGGVGVRSRGMVGGMGGGSVWERVGARGASGEGLGGEEGGRSGGGGVGGGAIVEFLALAHAPSLVFALHDSPEARLLTALAAAARGPLGLPPAAVEPAVCPSPMLPPLASLRFAQQMIMDEARGDVLSDSEGGVNELEDVDAQRGGACSTSPSTSTPPSQPPAFPSPPFPFPPTPPPLPRIPASPHPPITSHPTSTRTTLGVNGLTLMGREMGEDGRDVPHDAGSDLLKVAFVRHPLPRLLSAHGDKLANGGESRNVSMWNEMGEDDVMFHMTRRDLVKVVFVRHPLPRLLSAHGDKLANGGESRNVSLWNEVG
ncbi:unnamed protein product, partial [Closterium sp. Naga37s-1]